MGKAQLTLIEFSNSKEADQSINDLLPPKEVLMNTNILMQESTNVFELAPAERVQVFKHLFGLLGIDEAKETINDHRKELQTMIKVKSDTQHHSQKLQTALQQISRIWDALGSSLQAEGLEEILKERESKNKTWFYEDFHLVQNLEQIENFSFTEKDRSRSLSIKETLQASIQSLTKIQGQEEERKKQKERLEVELRQTQTSTSSLTHQIQGIMDQLKDSGNDELKILEEQQKVLQASLTDYEKQIPRDAIKDWGWTITLSSQITWFVQELLSAWAQLKEKSTSTQAQLKNINDTLSDHESRRAQLAEQKKQLTAAHEKQNFFKCDKIDGACPYVQVINKNASWALDLQIQTLHKQEKELEEKTKIIESQTPELQKEFDAIQQEILTLKSFLTKLDRKNLQSLWKNMDEILQQEQAINKEMQLLQAKKQQIHDLEKKHISLITQKQHLESRAEQITKELWSSEKTVDQAPKDISTSLQHHERSLSQIEEFITLNSQLESLSKEAKLHQKEVKQLDEKLSITKDLYQIFSKELMIVVLQDFLPSLQEVINSYLSQIVEYEVRFMTPEEEWSQLELDIQIVDEKGSRSVKSLSWGQKTILKLVWMLSVASLFRSSFLLLDETINNLDSETIAQVADVLEEFVSSQALSFYVVTHSPQIQQMSIWDSIIEV